MLSYLIWRCFSETWKNIIPLLSKPTLNKIPSLLPSILDQSTASTRPMH